MLAESGNGHFGAIVTGADYRGLGLVRSLGRRGIPVWVLKNGNHLLATFSRFAQRIIHWPSGSQPTRVQFLLDIAERYDLHGWVLLPTDDAAVSMISQHYDILGKVFRLTTPPWPELGRIVDKWLLYSLALELRIPRPWTSLPKTREELLRFRRPFPVILKPRWRESSNALTDAKAWRVDNLDDLLARYDEACALFAPDMIMIQEIIPGAGESQLSFAALCDRGQVLASLTARRSRQFPMDYGRQSTFVETIEAPEIVELSCRLLAALKFTGIVEVEYKQDQRDGQCKLLEMNPRVWGWQTLCGRAGVDFPYLLWLLIQGRLVPPLRGRPGVRWTRMITDVPISLREIAGGRMSPASYFRSLRGPREPAISSIDDPLPGLMEIPLMIYLFGKRILTGNRAW